MTKGTECHQAATNDFDHTSPAPPSIPWSFWAHVKIAWANDLAGTSLTDDGKCVDTNSSYTAGFGYR